MKNSLNTEIEGRSPKSEAENERSEVFTQTDPHEFRFSEIRKMCGSARGRDELRFARPPLPGYNEIFNEFEENPRNHRF